MYVAGLSVVRGEESDAETDLHRGETLLTIPKLRNQAAILSCKSAFGAENVVLVDLSKMTGRQEVFGEWPRVAQALQC